MEGFNEIIPLVRLECLDLFDSRHPAAALGILFV